MILDFKIVSRNLKFEKQSYINCITKCAESHFAKYNGKCRYILKAALGENRTKGAFQIVIGISTYDRRKSVRMENFKNIKFETTMIKQI